MRKDVRDIKDCHINIISFLYWLNQESSKTMWGGVKISDVIDSYLDLSGFTREQFDKIGNPYDERTTSI